MNAYVLPFEQLTMRDVETVGGKNASLGEMIGALAKLGVQVPGGFATTAQAYREFLAQGGLDERIRAELGNLNVDDVTKLAASGARIRQWILATPFPPALEAAVAAALTRMSAGKDIAVAVRSSATAEDLPEASFAGQQETFLNVTGTQAVLTAMHEVFASLFNDRAISYRVHQGFDHSAVALSAGVQHMVRSDLGASGVMFTLDTDSGFREVVFITASWGLGETVVQGAVNPDEFYLYKPALRAGKHPVVRRNLGSKAVKMVYAAAGSTAERQDQVQTLALPLSIPILVGYIFSITVASSGNPDLFFKVLAYLPPTAPFCMPVLVGLNQVTWWEFLASVLITIAGTAAMAVFAARIYRRAVLRTGGRVHLRELLARNAN